LVSIGLNKKGQECVRIDTVAGCDGDLGPSSAPLWCEWEGVLEYEIPAQDFASRAKEEQKDLVEKSTYTTFSRSGGRVYYGDRWWDDDDAVPTVSKKEESALVKADTTKSKRKALQSILNKPGKSSPPKLYFAETGNVTVMRGSMAVTTVTLTPQVRQVIRQVFHITDHQLTELIATKMFLIATQTGYRITDAKGETRAFKTKVPPACTTPTVRGC
jgi:hypothetical protein